MALCVIVSLTTAPPRPEQITDDLAFNLKTMNLGGGLGGPFRCSDGHGLGARFGLGFVGHV